MSLVDGSSEPVKKWSVWRSRDAGSTDPRERGDRGEFIERSHDEVADRITAADEAVPMSQAVAPIASRSPGHSKSPGEQLDRQHG